MKKNKILFLFIIFIFSLNIICISKVFANTDIENKYEEIQRNELENKSEDYKIYLNLSEEEKQKYEVIPEEYDVSVDEYYTNKENQDDDCTGVIKLIKSIIAQSAPKSFDLRSKINIRVENQNNYGNCWAFASFGALRTHLAVKGETDSNGTTIDFSELHLDYLSSELYTEKGNGNREIHTGGNFGTAEKYYRLNDGPVYESSLPYETTVQETQSKLNELDDMKPAYYVHEVIKFPNIEKIRKNGVTKMYNNGIELTEGEVEDIRKDIKQHIITNGGLYCSIREKDVFVGANLGEPYNTLEGRYSHYDDGTIPDNECDGHAVTIIGWDDNYDRNKFNAKNSKGEIVHPTKNGAYLILNSYGADALESGYQWISYEDSDVESNLAGYISVDKNPRKVIYTFDNDNAYNALKTAFEKEYMDMKTNDSYRSIEVYDIAIKSIQRLDLSINNLTDSDINEIFKIKYPNLKYLFLSYNKISKITPILKNTNLVYLDLDCNQNSRIKYSWNK